MIVAETLTAAGFYAVAMALQQRRARAVGREVATGVRLLRRLAVDPVWIGGLTANVAAYVLQFLALGQGALALVQPLLVTSLLFALVLSAAGGGTLERTEWAGAVAVAAGLALFYAAARPEAGSSAAGGARWATVVGVVGVLAGTLLAVAPRLGRDRPLALAAAAGVVYGLIAALTRATSVLARAAIRAHDLLGFLAHWQP